MAMGLAKLDLDQNCKILHYPTVDIVPGRLDLGQQCKRWHYPTVVIGLGRLDLGQDCKGWRYPRVGMAKHVSAPEGWHYPRVGMAKRSRWGGTIHGWEWQFESGEVPEGGIRPKPCGRGAHAMCESVWA